MHPRYEEIFSAITSNRQDKLTTLAQDIPQAPWIINEEGTSALQFALDQTKTNDRSLVVILLDKLFENALKDQNDLEAKFALNYAFLITVRHYLKTPRPTDYETFYFNVPQAFPFLKPANRGNTFRAALVTQLQSYIRSLSVGGVLRSFFVTHADEEINTILKGLQNSIMTWRSRPLFAQHAQSEGSGVLSTLRNFALSTGAVETLVHSTHTVTTFAKMDEALTLLIKSKDALPKDLTLIQASNLMLLCVKCYPFSKTKMQNYWVEVATSLLQTKQDSTELRQLYQIILDAQWLRTEDGIPYSQLTYTQSLLSHLEVSHIINMLQYFQANNLIQPLEKNFDLLLNLAPGQTQLAPAHELMALYALPTGRKVFVCPTISDNLSRKYLHFLLMNNPELSLSFGSPPVLFLHAPNTIILEIKENAQLPHLVSQVTSLSYAHKTISIAITRDVLKADKTNAWLLAIQEILGPNQTVLVQIYNELTHQGLTRIQADAIITHHSIELGPMMTAKQGDRPVYPRAFYDIYQKQPWFEYFAHKTEDDQYSVIKRAIENRKPLFFIFDEENHHERLWDKVVALLKEKNSSAPCMIRYDRASMSTTTENPIVTVKDYFINSQGAYQGPLTIAKLCVPPKKSTPAPAPAPAPAPNAGSSSHELGAGAVSGTSTSTLALYRHSPLAPLSPVSASTSNDPILGQRRPPKDMRDGDDYSGPGHYIGFDSDDSDGDGDDHTSGQGLFQL